MFIYLVFPVATLFLIFGVLHDRNDWLYSSVRRTLTLYRRLINRRTPQRSLLNENLESITSERPVVRTDDRIELENVPAQKTTISNIADHTKEKMSDAILGETRDTMKILNPPRYSFESVLSEEKDRDIDLPVIRTLQLGKTPDNATRISKQEETENIFESLKTTIEKTAVDPSSRLNTRQIYNLLMKESLKENEARQKLIDKKLNESLPIEIKEQVPSSSQNKSEREDKNKR
ncbi:hypothetical protein WH47_00982 [Habropoda laboriosa]|uniref:Uncharacterized protein n=1 Tax=Habropoda laboriosa TaxID=597456 RepID=A0A0L7R5J3_9HYME|nr:PREDICTED: uncharacterized protein LOC108571643 [Habropoda laboriosa]KOC66089.1 hypothetical protein WH47_00982 [Habropoda laboriosa]